MVLASTDENLVSIRFPPYVEELQDFLAGRSLRFGAPEDIFPFAERLSGSSSFRDDMSSLVRAVIYREHEGITQSDLLKLVTLAIGGPAFDITAQPFHKPISQLLAFLGGAVRSLWQRFPDESSERTAAGPIPIDHAGPPAEPVPAPAATEVPSTPRYLEEVQVVPAPAEPQGKAPDPEPEMAFRAGRNQVSSRVRTVWRDAEAPLAGEDLLPAVQPEPPGLLTAQRLPYWMVGFCGVALGLTAGLLLRTRPAVPTHPPARTEAKTFQPWFPPVPQPSPDASVPVGKDVLPSLPKPSPYGPPLDAPTAGSSLGSTADAAAPEPTPSGSNTSAPSRTAARRSTRQPVPPAPSQLLWRPNAPRTARPARPASPVPSRTYGAPSPYSPPVQNRAHLDWPGSPRPERYAEPSPALRHGEVYLSVSGLMAGNLLSAPIPAYPERASAAGVEGTVVVQAVVGLDGSVVATRVLSGPEPLRDAAQNAVRHWRYRPFLVAGRTNMAAIDATLHFRLRP